MTLQTQRIDVVADEQAWVGGAVRKMAGGTALKLERRMLVDKGAKGFRMALRADCVLIRARFEQLVLEGAMGIMAVSADQHSFIHFVMEWLGEGGLYIGVAGIA
jgi:hypothetical protein